MRLVLAALFTAACGSRAPAPVEAAAPAPSAGQGPCCMGDAEQCAPGGVLAQVFRVYTLVRPRLREDERARWDAIDLAGTRSGGVAGARAARFAEADAVVRALVPLALERGSGGDAWWSDASQASRSRAAERLRALDPIHDEASAGRAQLALDEITATLTSEAEAARPNNENAGPIDVTASATEVLESTAAGVDGEADLDCYPLFSGPAGPAGLASDLLEHGPREAVVDALIAMLRSVAGAARAAR